MLKSIILFLLLFFQFSTFSQDKVFVVDSIMDVYMRNGYANEHFMPKGKYDESEKRIGEWKDYEVSFENVFLIDEKEYPTVRSGMYLIFGKGEYENDNRVGEWEHYALEDQSFKKIHFKTSTYVNGMQQGPAVYYYPNGSIAGKTTFTDDLLDGEFVQFYPNGEIYATMMFEKSLKEGVQLVYGKTGNLSSSKSFLNDTVHGTYLNYYKNGKVQASTEYKMGVEHGSYKYFRENGELWTEKKYVDGLLMNVSTFSEEGEELENGTLKDGNGTLKYFQKNGSVYLIETYENGVVVSEKRSEEFEW